MTHQEERERTEGALVLGAHAWRERPVDSGSLAGSGGEVMPWN